MTETQIQNIVVTLAAVGLLLSIRFLPRLLSGAKLVPPAELKRRMDAGEDLVVIDVRGPEEFVNYMGHVPGAVNVPLDVLAGRLARLATDLAPYKNQPVFVICRTDNRSAHGARLLKKAGFAHLFVVKGGMEGWSLAKLPAEGRTG